MWPMTESRYTHVGAGAYTGSNGTTYYVLHAAYVAGGGSYVEDEPGVPAEQLVEPVFTVTPQEDGSIVHTVKYGQALSTIATWYGVTIDQIMQLNNLINENIYVGQTLIIRLAPTPTDHTHAHQYPRQPTRTPSLTPTPTRQVTPRTPTPTDRSGAGGKAAQNRSPVAGIWSADHQCDRIGACFVFRFYQRKVEEIEKAAGWRLFSCSWL